VPKSHPPYPPEYRQRIVELVRSGRTPQELAREFEPSAQCIRDWVKAAEQPQGVCSDGLTQADHAELIRLRREVKILRQEKEILKKAAAWFARESSLLPPDASGS
jgi:transposase